MRIEKERTVMKKKAAILSCCLALLGALTAQPAGLDSLIGVPSGYVISDNYQRCVRFETCPEEYLDRNYFWLDYYAGRGDSTEMIVTKAFTGHRLPVKGVAVMTLTYMADVNPYHPSEYHIDTLRVEEEVLLYTMDSRGQWTVVRAPWTEKAVARDVAVPQCTQTMSMGDDSKYIHFGLEEVLLPRPVAVDSFFFVGGTMRNNRKTMDGYGVERFVHKPTLYPYIAERYNDPCGDCVYEDGHYVVGEDWGVDSGESARLDGEKMWSGPFFLIVDTGHYRLTAMSSNDTMGAVMGGGIYGSLERASVEATAFAGYHFVRWDDGSTENPREIEVFSDSLVVAFFRSDGDTVGIDHSGFGARGSGLRVYPNPAQEEIFVTRCVNGDPDASPWTLKLLDASGRTVMQRSFQGSVKLDVGHLPAGQYFLMATGRDGTYVEAFVKR